MTIEASGGTVHWLDTGEGVRLRAAHWPGGGRGTALVLQGRAEFIEKYLETVGELRARGFAVWTLDWRGQGGSSRPLPDRLAQHVERFEAYLDDLALLLDRLVEPGLEGRPLALIGHSMGGHLGARMLALRPGLFARAALCAPMMGFRRFGGLPGWAARGVVRLVCVRGRWQVRYGPGVRRGVDLARPFEGNRLTGCRRRYEAGLALARERPDLALGGVTWGWLQAAMGSMATTGTAAFGRRLTMPVLVVLAGREEVVDNVAARRFASALPKGEVVEIAEARHELLQELDRLRAASWAAMDRFLAPL